jgi:hypothetical protein
MLKTQDKPDHPLIFGLLSMIDANIYLALKYFKPEQWSDKTHQHVRETMAQFLLSHAPQTPMVGPAPVQRRSKAIPDHIVMFRDPARKKTKGHHCSVHKLVFPGETGSFRTLMYCGKCGADAGFFCTPRPGNGGRCWNYHIQNSTA